MNVLAQLDHLNLDPMAKTQLATAVQALLDQAQKTAESQLKAKDAEIHAKEGRD